MKCDGCGREVGSTTNSLCRECYDACDGYDLRHVPDKALRAEYDRRHLPLVPAAFGHARMEAAKLREERDEWKRRGEAAERLLGASRGLGLASLIGGDAVGTCEVLHDPTAVRARVFEPACDCQEPGTFVRPHTRECARARHLFRATTPEDARFARNMSEQGPGIAARPVVVEAWPLEVDLLADDE